MRVLAVSDEVDERLRSVEVRRMAPDLIVGCGDVPFELLGLLAESTGAPLVFVPGNHDPDLSGYKPTAQGLVVRAGFVTEAPWPDGTTSADGRVDQAAGLVIAGLGGCLRYREGPNQYSERQQARRARRLSRRVRYYQRRHHRAIDIVLTHAGPRGLDDGEDRAHQGFECYHRLIEVLRPRLLLHGHHNPTGGAPDRLVGSTRVINVFGHRLIELPDGPEPPGSRGSGVGGSGVGGSGPQESGLRELGLRESGE